MQILNKLIKNFTNSNTNIDLFINELKNALNKPSSSTYIVDRIENDYAVCENTNTLKMETIPINSLPKNIKQGYILQSNNQEFIINHELTNKRKEFLKNKIDKAWKN